MSVTETPAVPAAGSEPACQFATSSSENRREAPAHAANLFLLDDLDDVGRTGRLQEGDRNALHAVAHWIQNFVARPHEDLGRPGPVCPFVPRGWERKIIWLAPERIGRRSLDDVRDLVGIYKRLLLDAPPVEGELANYKAMVVVFTDLSTDRAGPLFDDVLQRLAVPSYAEDGLVMGGFYETNQGTALYNPDFRPFTSPVPFLLMRHAVVGDWKFFLNQEDWLNRWTRRFGEAAVHALAEKLRDLPWRSSLYEFDGFASRSDNS